MGLQTGSSATLEDAVELQSQVEARLNDLSISTANVASIVIRTSLSQS
jgi:hypothetical protein